MMLTEGEKKKAARRQCAQSTRSDFASSAPLQASVTDKAESIQYKGGVHLSLDCCVLKFDTSDKKTGGRRGHEMFHIIWTEMYPGV